MNLADMQSGLEGAIDDFRSGDKSIDTLLDRFVETAELVGGDRSRNTAAGVFVGGIAGAPLGPAGIYAGIVAGSSISFFMTPKDERTIIVIPVDEIPDDAEVVPSNHPAIDDVSPIQLVVESAADGEDEDWVRETNTRSWDMDEVESHLVTFQSTRQTIHPRAATIFGMLRLAESWCLSLVSPTTASPRGNI